MSISRRSEAVVWLLIAAMVAAGAWLVVELPPDARVATHFNAQGEADGWSSPWVAAFVMPATAMLLWGLMRLLPRIDPRGANLLRSSAAVGTIRVAVTAVLAIAHATIVAGAMGADGPRPSFGPLVVGGLLIVMGNVMGKLRQNYSVGIRTPWTLADERVWDQTHRFGGKLMVAGGLLLCAIGLFRLAPGHELPAVLGVTLGCAAAAVGKSYLLWRARRPAAG